MDRPRRDGDLLVHVRRGALVAVTMLALAAVLTALVAADPKAPPILGPLDVGWRGVTQPPPAWLEAFSRWLYALGSGVVMVPVRVAVAVWLAVRKRYVDLAAWLLAWAVADLATQVLKPAIGRVRPDLADTSSFPSGHAKSAAQVAVGLVLLLPFGRRVWAWWLASFWIAAMALSRTIVDDHWASDVVAGALIGAGCAVGAAAFCQWRRDRRRSGGSTPRKPDPPRPLVEVAGVLDLLRPPRQTEGMDEDLPPCCFDDWARATAQRARDRETVDAISTRLLAELDAVGLEGRTVLDVGCGAGDLALGALARGATRSSGIDLGHGAIDEARRLADARGLADRASFSVGDGSKAELPVSDVVVLNRVVCCYPDLDRLLTNTLSATAHVYAFTALVDRGPIGLGLRLVSRLGNVWFALRRRRYRGYRSYVHDVAGIDAHVRAAGFEPVVRGRRRVVWELAVYRR